MTVALHTDALNVAVLLSAIGREERTNKQTERLVRAAPVPFYVVDGLPYAAPDADFSEALRAAQTLCKDLDHPGSNPNAAMECGRHADCLEAKRILVTLGPAARNKKQPWHPRSPQRANRLPRENGFHMVVEDCMRQRDIAPLVRRTQQGRFTRQNNETDRRIAA